MLFDVGVVPGDLALNLLPKPLPTCRVARNRIELPGAQSPLQSLPGDLVQIEAGLGGEFDELLVQLDLDPDLGGIVHEGPHRLPKSNRRKVRRQIRAQNSRYSSSKTFVIIPAPASSPA